MIAVARNMLIPMVMAGVGIGMILGGAFKNGGPVVTVVGVLLAGVGFYRSGLLSSAAWSKRSTVIIGGLFLALAIFFSWLLYAASVRSAAQTAEAMATVLRAEREPQRGDDNTLLTLSFQTGSNNAQARARIQGVHMDEYPAGRQLRICYDPADPRSVRIDNGPCG